MANNPYVNKVVYGNQTLIDISDTTATAADVLAGRYFYTAAGAKTLGTGSGGGGSVTQDQDGYIVLPSTGGGGGGGATQHTIHLEFSDSTDTDIDVYYDDSLIGTMITAYEPSTWTYNNKTVYIAELDGVEWYDATPLPYTWITLYEGNASFSSESDDSYAWISSLASETVTEGSVWRVTWGNETKTHNAVYGAPWSGASNRWHINSTTDGTNGVYVITPYDSNAWVFIDFDDLSAHNKYVKLEKATT